jgi:hypothetical protein
MQIITSRVVIGRQAAPLRRGARCGGRQSSRSRVGPAALRPSAVQPFRRRVLVAANENEEPEPEYDEDGLWIGANQLTLELRCDTASPRIPLIKVPRSRSSPGRAPQALTARSGRTQRNSKEWLSSVQCSLLSSRSATWALPSFCRCCTINQSSCARLPSCLVIHAKKEPLRSEADGLASLRRFQYSWRCECSFALWRWVAAVAADIDRFAFTDWHPVPLIAHRSHAV